MSGPDMESFTRKLDGCDCVSFDIYDTILVRPYVKPTDLFTHVEEITGIVGFASRRVAAEGDARRIHHREITLDEIYNLLQFPEAREVELRLERNTPLPYKPVIRLMDAARSTGKKIILISDMYLPSDLISNILHDRHIQYDALYVSSDYGCSKHDGGLFDIVLEDMSLDPVRLLHVGDNRHSDLKVPSSKGIGCFPVRRPIDVYFSKYPDARRYYKRVPTLCRSIIVSLEMMAISRGDMASSIGSRIGGPLVYGYSEHLCRSLPRGHRILFASRDGYNLKEVIRILNPSFTDTRYIHAQRILQYVLTEDKLPFGRIDVPDRLTHRFDHGTAVSRMRFIMGFLKEDLGISVPSEDDDLISLYNGLSDRIDSLRRQKRAQYKAYLDDILGTGDVDLVDCTTMRYTSQRLISNLTGRKLKGHYFITLDSNGAPDHESYHVRDKPVVGWLRVNIPEFFMCSPELPLSGWDNGPVFDDDPPEWELERSRTYPGITEGECTYAGLVRDVFGDDLPRFGYRDTVDWSITATMMEPSFKKHLSSERWASGPDHADWQPLIPSIHDIPLLIRRFVTDVISKMNGN